MIISRKMRQIRFFFILLFSLTSCSTMQKFVVTGRPGTEIYSPNLEKIGTIGEKGEANLQISSDSGYEYLWSKTQEGDYIPFALDYKHCMYLGDNLCKYGGMYLAAMGSFSLLLGSTILLLAEEEIALPFFYAGLGLDAIGLGIGVPGGMRAGQIAEQWHYKIASAQQTNQDIVLNKVDNNGARRVNKSTAERSKSDVDVAGIVIKEPKGKTVVSRRFRDYSRSVTGVYSGRGLLLYGSDVVESISNLKVVIAPIDDRTASVNIMENETPFFDADLIYSISKDGDVIRMSLEGVPDAIIEISPSGELRFIHPSISIGNNIYKLEINARKSLFLSVSSSR